MKQFFLLCGFISLVSAASAQLNTDAAKKMLQRVVPAHAAGFVVEALPQDAGQDVFEIASRSGKIVLRGNNGVAVASALYYYLNEYCHCQLTWNGVNMQLPARLPVVKTPVRKNTAYTYRYYLNYCTFNYSMSWWDWPRWEKEIDWMALHGINMPLAITGEEYTWYEVYKDMGFTDTDLQSFFSGPAYFSWFWMGNLDAWGGPLPFSWMQSHRLLQQKILQRERALGMHPVLPAFTGHVPAAFKKKYPQARLKATNWNNGFADTYILDAADPLFAEIGKRFLQKQTALFGTDHLYSADTFNENEPPSDDPDFLARLSAKVYEGMHSADTAAVWVMQGWLFYSDKKFWKAPQTEALLKAVPDNKMILLDLAAEIEPVWKRTSAFYGKPWIWNMLNNFGGNTNLFGRMDGVATGPAAAWNDPRKGRMAGIGLTMEGIEQNPVIYELMTAHTWRTNEISLDEWLPAYIRNRYGAADTAAIRAWKVLHATVYNGRRIRDGAESILQARPTFDSLTQWTKTTLNYAAEDLLPAWDALLQAADHCGSYDGYRFDLVDLTRQVLANYALPLQRKWVAAYHNNDTAAFDRYSTAFIQLIDDMDQLLATRKDFLLGSWIADARRCGTTPAEKNLYEKNARNLITLWGDAASPLHEYACRQWSGLFSSFYKPRWQQFFTLLTVALRSAAKPDLDGFKQQVAQWEWQWVNRREDYPVTPSGDEVETVRRLYHKYREHVAAAYSN